jgi:hypothetical protein
VKTTSKKTTIELTEREIAQAKLEDAEAADRRALDAITHARQAVMSAEARWEECPRDEADAAREARDDARRRLDQLEREGGYRRTAKQLALALANLKEAVKREQTARLEAIKPRLSAFASELDDLMLKWIEVDRAAERLAASTAEATSAHHALYVEAKAIATDLGLPIADLGPQPDRAEIALLVRKAVTLARREENAEHRQGVLDQYLRAQSTDWQTAGMSAADLDDLDRAAARNASIRRDMELAQAHAAGVAFGRQPPAEKPKAAKENAS